MLTSAAPYVTVEEKKTVGNDASLLRGSVAGLAGEKASWIH